MSKSEILVEAESWVSFFKFKVHMLKVKQNMMGVFCTCHHTMLVIVCSFSFCIRVCMQALTRLANLCRFWVPLTNPFFSTWFMLSLRCVEVILAQKMFCNMLKSTSSYHSKAASSSGRSPGCTCARVQPRHLKTPLASVASLI